MYQPYPSSGPVPEPVPEPVQQEPPSSVKTAVRLMYAGAVVNALSLIIFLATIGSLRSAVHRAAPTLTPSQLHSYEVFFVTVTVASGVIGIALWLWMAFMCKAGKNWARITGTVFFGIDTLLTVDSLVRAGAAATLVVNILGWLVGLGAVILLWRKDSSAFFKPSEYQPNAPWQA